VLAASPKIIFLDHADGLVSHDDRAALASLLDDVAVGTADPAVIIAVRDRATVADLMPARSTTVSLTAADLVDARK
jgi:RND superfamily putative drug exporter